MGNKGSSSSSSSQQKSTHTNQIIQPPPADDDCLPPKILKQLVKQEQKIKKLWYTEDECLELEQIIDMEQQLQKEEQFQQKEQSILDIDAKLGEQLENLKFRLIPRTHSLKPSEQPQLLPVVLEIEALKSQEKTEKIDKKEKAAIDLVCVVDTSGSMEGKKLNLVTDSLRYIMKILGPQDRISLVTFDTNSYINLPWLKNTPDNKELVKSSILNMQTKGSTNIAAGVQKGLWMIKSRKTKNPVTCMFVLSDGQDDYKGADLRCQQHIEKMNIQDTFVINTFGYGKEHDSVVMNNISNLKGGSFVFIENVEKASENFILAISGMLSIFAKNVVVRIKSIGQHKIQRIFGGDLLWNKIDEVTYEMNINYLIQGHQVKDFVFEMNVVTENNQSVVLKSNISGEIIKLQTEFQKDEELVILFNGEEEQANEHVEINYLRAKAGDIIGEAQKLANSKKYDEAIQLINRMMDEINESNQKDQQILQVVLEDLEQIKQICTPQKYQQQGLALMLNKQKNHLKQQNSLNNSMEWESDQEEQMDAFRNGNLQLSVCDMQDNYQNEAFEFPQLQNSQKRLSMNSDEYSM